MNSMKSFDNLQNPITAPNKHLQAVNQGNCLFFAGSNRVTTK